jgi:hypothetical protein
MGRGRVVRAFPTNTPVFGPELKSPLNVCLMSTGDGGGVAYHATRKNAADCVVPRLQNSDEH